MSVDAYILLDNSLSLGGGNLAICRETIRYILDNAPEPVMFTLMLSGESTEIIGKASDGREVLKERLSSVGLVDRDGPLTDNLTELLLQWKRADVTDRCIILFTDGKEEESVAHTREELYYLLYRLDFPVYVVDCVTGGELSAKNLSAISTISDGELFYSEFQGSEAEIERKLGDRILFLMDVKYSLTGRYTDETAAAEPQAETEEAGYADVGELTEEAGAGTDEVLAEASGTEETFMLKEAFSGRETVMESKYLKKEFPYITVMSSVFFAIIIITIIMLVTAKRRRPKTKPVPVRSRRAVYSEGEEDMTVCRKEKALPSSDTMLLFEQGRGINEGL